jgi:hypothetical protein
MTSIGALTEPLFEFRVGDYVSRTSIRKDIGHFVYYQNGPLKGMGILIDNKILKILDRQMRESGETLLKVQEKPDIL